MDDPTAPELERPPHLALAAKLLVGLGFAIAVLFTWSQASHAAERPPGPLGGAVERVTAGEPVREVAREVTRTVRAVAAPVVTVSKPAEVRTPTRPTRHVERPRAERPRAERTIRVLPREDGTEALRLDLHLDRHDLDVTVTPRTAGRALPISVQLPSLLPALPSIDVTVVDGARVQRGDEVSLHEAAAVDPGMAVAPVAGAGVAEEPEARAARAERAPEPIAPATPKPVRNEGSEAPLSTGAAIGAGAVLAVLAVQALRRPARPSQFVLAVRNRVPVAPTFRPSFTPD